MSVKSEDRIQQECYRWFNNSFPKFRGLLFHVPNGGARNGREAVKLKTMGVYPGVSDFIFLHNVRANLIELKTEIGSQSPAQKKWEITITGQGFDYYIVRNLEEFIELIHKIIENGNN